MTDIIPIPKLPSADHNLPPVLNTALDVMTPVPAGVLDDATALTHWLEIFYLRSKHTFRSYKKEAMRFRMFLHALHGPSPWLLRDATERDVQCYHDALRGDSFPLPPDLPEDRMALFEHDALDAATGGSPGFATLKPSPELLSSHGFTSTRHDAPFSRPLNAHSLGQALAVISAMYEFWREPAAGRLEPYVTSNPVRRVRRTRSFARTQVDRYVPEEAIRAMHAICRRNVQEAEQRARQSAAENGKEGGKGNRNSGVLMARRMSWMFALLFGLWVRRAEAVSMDMGDFRNSLDGWTVRFIRKGGKEAILPVPGWVMDALRDYREALGLPRNPDAPEATQDARQAAIQSTRRKAKGRMSRNGVSDNTLYAEIKILAHQTALALENGDLDLEWPAGLNQMSPEQLEHRRQIIIQKLDTFSPHWFRHSGATIGINSGRIAAKSASNLLGHASEHTTSSMYHHSDSSHTREGVESMGDVLGPDH